MRVLFFILLFCLPVSATADVNIVIEDGDVYYRKGGSSVSGTIYNVKRRDLKIQTNDGRVTLDMSEIKFGDRLNEIFAEGMIVSAEGTYKDRDDFTAYSIQFNRDGKTYTYRSKVGTKAPRLYRLID